MKRISPTLILVLLGIVLPNVVFLGALAIGLAGEPRLLAISLYCLILVLPLSRGARLILFPIILTLDLLAVISGLFGFGLVTMLTNAPFVFDIRASADRVYLTLGTLFSAVLAVSMVLLWTQHRKVAAGNRSVLLALTLGMLVSDFVVYASDMHSSSSLSITGRALPAFGSGTEMSGLKSVLADETKPDVLFVMVESYGLFHEDRYRDLVTAPLRNDALLARYDIRTGTTPFWQSTTSAEMREMCGSQDSYRDMDTALGQQCLPALFQRAGYSTTGVHGYRSDFFSRSTWYPMTGFQHVVFGEDLIDQFGDRHCGAVWRGLCDPELATYVGGLFSRSDKPAFVYWLTLNTHVPIGPNAGTGELKCGTPAAPIANSEVCRMTELWRQTFAQVAEIARSHPDLEVLIVGDHRPPLMWRAARKMFSDTEVPWLRLSPKRLAPALSSTPKHPANG